jgi:hypothetical protein
VVEGLEDRKLLYATLGYWYQPTRVTYSFMPDGTSIGGTPSSLFQTMNQYESTAAWESAFQQAAAEWEDVAKINFAPVSDDGSAVGSGNFQQGAPNFGDIRVGAMPLSGGALAETFLPAPSTGGSEAGDIIFNSNINWGSGGYDLETVALHELGHAIGMDHTTVNGAVMYPSYQGVKAQLTSDDIAGIQSIYCARVQTNLNTTPLLATAISLNGNDQATISTAIQTATEQDWYSVVVPAGASNTLTVTVQSSNLSLLEPRVTLYNSSVQGLAQGSTTTLGGTATISWSGVTPLQLYYVRVTSNTSGTGHAGRYGLEVNLGTGTMGPVAPANTQVATFPDNGGGSINLSGGHHRHRHQSTLPNSAGIVTLGDLKGPGDALMANVRALHRGRPSH